MSGHFAKNAGGLASSQSPLPPAQAVNPADPIRSTPIRSTVGPVTMGGNILCKAFGGRNERLISTSEQRAAVPISAPYALGQAS
jgi:hypothetical protein